MAKDLSIVFKAVDNLTNTVNQMRYSTRNLTKDITDFKKVKEEAFEKKAEVKLETQKAKQELKELEKAVKSGQDGAEKAFTAQQKKVLQLEEAYRSLGKTIKDASNGERKLAEDMSRSKNAASIQGKNQNEAGLVSTLGKAGLYGMVGQAGANFANYALTSQLGAGTGGAIGSIVSGAATGAAMGSVVPGVGTAVGAGLGAVAGGLNAMTQKLEKKDDLYREDIKGLFNATKENTKASLDSGIQLAGKFEQDMISFTTLLKGKDNANKFLSEVQEFGARTPFESNDILDISKKLMTFGYKQEEILPMMTKVGDAGSALGMSKEDMSWVATSLGRMKATGKTTLEYINPLLERGIPVWDYLAKASGKTNKEVQEMVHKGLVPGEKAASAIADYMGKQFEGNMEKQSHTYEGLVSTLEDNKKMLDKAMGEAYNNERKKGLENEISAISGPMGEQMKYAYEKIGEFKADLENKHQESINKALEDTMNGADFNVAKQQQDKAKMGELLEEARVKAEIEFRKTKGYQLQQQADLDLVTRIQGDASVLGGYYNMGQTMADQFTKGFQESASSKVGGILSDISNQVGSYSMNVIDSTIAEHEKNKKEGKLAGPGDDIFSQTWRWISGSHATGLDRVPYNGYIAELHEGERVLTKSQANTVNYGSGGGVVINMNNTVREESDINKIAQALVSELNKHQASYGGGQ